MVWSFRKDGFGASGADMWEGRNGDSPPSPSSEEYPFLRGDRDGGDANNEVDCDDGVGFCAGSGKNDLTFPLSPPFLREYSSLSIGETRFDLADSPF